MKKKMLWRIILILFVCIIIGIGVFTIFIKEDNRKKNEKTIKNDTKNVEFFSNSKNAVLKFKTYGSAEILNNKYIIEKNEDIVYSIRDLDGNFLYKSKDEFVNVKYYRSAIREGVDGNLYYISTDENSSYLKVYKLVDGEFELIIENDLEEGKSNDYKRFACIEMYDYLIGFTINYDYIIDLNGNRYNYLVQSSSAMLDYSQPYTVNNDRYIPVVVDVVDDTQIPYKVKVGVLDLKKKELVDGIVYDDMFVYGKDYILVKKEDKYGVVDINNNILIPIEYDFIDSYKGDYYLLGKDNNIILMDKEYKIIQEFFAEVTNYTRPCCLDFDTFGLSKLKDNYLIYTYKDYSERTNMKMHFITSDGNYKLVNDIFKDSIDFRTYDDKLVVLFKNEFKVYDYNLNLITTVALEESYDYLPREYVNSIMIFTVDENKKRYYNIETNEFMDSEKGFELLSVNNIKVLVDDNAIKVYDKDKYINQIGIDSDISYDDTTNSVIIKRLYAENGYSLYILSK